MPASQPNERRSFPQLRTVRCFAGLGRAIWAASLVFLLSSSPNAQPQTPLPTTAEAVVALRARQNNAIDAILRDAQRFGNSDSPAYTARVLEALPLLGMILTGVNDFEAVLEQELQREPPVPTALDSDPAFQSRLAGIVAATRQSIAEPERSGARVVGGSLILDPLFAEVVAIKGAQGVHCTGTYLGSNRVLTATHCVCDAQRPGDGRGLNVVFGDNVGDAGRMLGRPRQLFAIVTSKTTIFPGSPGSGRQQCRRWLSSGGGSAEMQDLAILVLDGAIPPEYPVATLAAGEAVARTLSETGDISNPFFVAGFGMSRFQGGNAGVTSGEKFGAFILGGEMCPASGQFRSSPAGCRPGGEVSAFDTARRDTCDGDSGGPLLVRNAGAGGWALAGVTSRALGTAPRCGRGGIYALITTDVVRRWLRENGVALE